MTHPTQHANHSSASLISQADIDAAVGSSLALGTLPQTTPSHTRHPKKKSRKKVYSIIPKKTPFQILSNAIRDNDVLLVKQLIQDDPLLVQEMEPYFQISALMRATIQGNLEIVHFLLDEGSDIEASNQYGYTALMLGAFHGQLDVVNYLLDQGANAHAQSNDTGSTALHWAAERGHEDVCRLLLQYGVSCTELCDSQLRTARDVAQSFNRHTIVHLFDNHTSQNQ